MTTNGKRKPDQQGDSDMARKCVLSIGQCAFDHNSLKNLLGREFHADVIACDTEEAARAELANGQFDLILVNRILDTTGDAGLDIIHSIRSSPELASCPVMLISNFEEAQQTAVAAGALPGFGKAALWDSETIQCIRSALLASEAAAGTRSSDGNPKGTNENSLQ